MMLAFLYHRAGSGKRANPLEMLERHFALLSSRCRIVLPGEPLPLFSRSVCLTFDDATYDFYHYVYPLLKRFGLRALLAVPAGYILDETDALPELRLSVPSAEAMKGDVFRTHAPFCTWAELREMAQSGHVAIASHSYTHTHLLAPGVQLDLEIMGSKTLLEDKLQRAVDTFVYPLGKFSNEIHRRVKERYPFAMRIGAAWNWSWQNKNGLIYRIVSDNLVCPEQHLQCKRLFALSWFYLLNTLRGR